MKFNDWVWMFFEDVGEWVRGLCPVRWVHWKIYYLRRRAKVRRNWERYEEVLESIYGPFFDVSQKSSLKYLSHPDDWYCMFCGCHYVRNSDDWERNESERQQHDEFCLWHKIEQLQRL